MLTQAPKMGAEITYLALAASILMGLGGACLFIFAVKRDYFHNLEEAKYHVFWPDIEELVEQSTEQTTDEHKG
ncbi:MAG: cbb3-type cytochrome oxidase assembly protein [Bryobacterales bacterium]|nr:cbb3-type cytochrome oxidase assembly protein [Bryobacterales bacterium]